MAIIANLFIDQGTDFSITVDVTDAAGTALNRTKWAAARDVLKKENAHALEIVLALAQAQPHRRTCTGADPDTF